MGRRRGRPPRVDGLDGRAQIETDWSLSLDAQFPPEESPISSLRFGLFRDIADSIRLALERDLDKSRVYASIIAFPEALLRYAPARPSPSPVGRRAIVA